MAVFLCCPLLRAPRSSPEPPPPGRVGLGGSVNSPRQRSEVSSVRCGAGDGAECMWSEETGSPGAGEAARPGYPSPGHGSFLIPRAARAADRRRHRGLPARGRGLAAGRSCDCGCFFPSSDRQAAVNDFFHFERTVRYRISKQNPSSTDRDLRIFFLMTVSITLCPK